MPNHKKNILLIEDESGIADTIDYALSTEGFQVHWHSLGQSGVEAAQKTPIDLIILDVGLPDMSGFDVCREIRRFSDVPIIFLTARHEEIDRIVGLEIGGDDYVVKPFSPRELAARVRVILRRVQQQSAPLPLTQNPKPEPKSSYAFVIDSSRAHISYHGQRLSLTRYEYRLLKTLLSQPERVFSRAQLMDQVWESPESSLERAVDSHIKSLRAKLQQVNHDVQPIKTHRGLGYSIKGCAREL